MGKKRGWRQELDNELRDYFDGAYAAGAGLRCGMSPSFGGGNPSDVSPPPVVRFGHSERDTMVQVEQALALLREGNDRFAASPHLFAVLAAFYVPRGTGALSGMSEIKSDAGPAVAALTDAVRRATEAWMRQQCAAELAAELAAYAKAEEGLAEKAAVLRETVERGAKGAHGAARRKLEAIESSAQDVDVESRVRTRWGRPPMHDELVATLRRACVDARNPSPGRDAAARRVAARKLCRTADSQARRDLEAARNEYARVRDLIDRLLGAKAQALRFASSLELGIGGKR